MAPTAADKRIAVRVLMESKQVRKWVDAELRFMGIDLDSVQAEELRPIELRKAAERLIR